jgi:protein TonB
MKKNTSATTWDDVIFENRNKEYGAFAIRRNYSDNVLKGMVTMIAFAAMILTSPLWLPDAAEKIAKTTGGLKDPTDFFPTPKIIPDKLKVVPTAAKPATVTNPTFRVTTQEVPDTQLPAPDANTSSSEGTETGTAIIAASTGGEGTGVVEAPAVAAPPTVVDIAEVMPQYEGGLEAMAKFLQKKLRYPAHARRMGIQGTVFVGFVVSTTGEITQVKIIKSLSEDCDKEAVRVVSMMPPWKAGMQNKMPVAVRMVLPIKFHMPDL